MIQEATDSTKLVNQGNEGIVLSLTSQHSEYRHVANEYFTWILPHWTQVLTHSEQGLYSVCQLSSSHHALNQISVVLKSTKPNYMYTNIQRYIHTKTYKKTIVEKQPICWPYHLTVHTKNWLCLLSLEFRNPKWKFALVKV